MDAKIVAALAGDAYKASPAGNLTRPNIPTADSGGSVEGSAVSGITSLAKKAGSFLSSLIPKSPLQVIVPGTDAAETVVKNASAAGRDTAAAFKKSAETISSKVGTYAGAALGIVILVFGIWVFSTIKNAGR